MSTPNDLQALLASIRPRPSPPNAPGQDHYHQQRPQQGFPPPGMFPPHPQQQPYDGQSFPHPYPHGYHHPSVSSTIQSPSPMNTPPRHGSDILSPNVPTPRTEWQPQQPQPPRQQNNQDSAASLLNLLRFSQGPAAAVSQPVQAVAPEQSRSPPVLESTSSHGRNISASDLVASLFGKQAPAATAAAPPPPPAAPAGVSPAQPEGPNDNTQEMLLRLLNRSQPSAGAAEAPALVAASPSIPSEAAPTSQGIQDAFVEVLESSPNGSAKPETAVSPSKESLFTYVNPFDQLAAISPRNKSPQPKSDAEAPVIDVTKKQKIHVSASIDPSPAPEVAEPPKRSKSPVLESGQREAVNEVVGRLVDEIGRSLSGGQPKPVMEAETIPTAAKEEDPSEAAFLETIRARLRDKAAEVKAAETKAMEASAAAAKEPEHLEAYTESAKQTETDTAPTPVGQSGNENPDALVDSWESAEDSAEKDEERIVLVHNFPLRPFISITVKPQSGKLVDFRDDGIMDIARLKKEFDQLDRSLTAATSDYIAYALAKTGGIRIIRQDDGSDRQVFRATRDRAFNVALCTSPPGSGLSDVQAILGIGVSGTVYWALISRDGKDLFELDALESESLIFPPFPASDENTSGGQLKTRAKRSSRHPDLFAIGRGKNIYVISPQAAMKASYGVSGSQRTVNTEKFFKERALKISTGKAGKDFAFSDDDTVIASLDKTGRLRFWDITDILDNPAFIEGPPMSEVRVPLNTFVTGSPAEKSWPTSVLFLDKLRAYSRSMALRYVLVGLKQNHTLQLWDIGLGKAVEEVKFPHENESDAICSVAYHPASGIIVVGHPTRNSIYFVHLSAPRYNLPVMSQAAFIKAATDKENTLPKPESTACLSGIREISLGSKGQLRSLELLPITKSATDKRGTEDTGLFELYVMHSRGVTCLNIKKEDLGWTDDNKVIRAVDGLEHGSIEISDLQTFPSYVTDDPSVNGDSASTPSRTAKEPTKKTEFLESNSGVVPSRNASPTKTSKKKVSEELAEITSAPGNSEKAEKKKKKKSSTVTSEAAVKAKEPTTTAGVQPLPIDNQLKDAETLASSTATMSATQAAERAVPAGLVSSLPNAGLSGEALNKHLETLQNSVSNEFTKSLGREFEALYRRFDDERRSWDAASTAKQDQVLRLVSSTLSDNVEKNLTRIVSNSIQTEVVPAISDATSAAVRQQLGSVLNDELRQALPKSVTSALQQPAVMKAVADSVAQKLAPRIDAEIARAVQGLVSPLMDNMARSNKKAEADMEQFFHAQVKQHEAQRQNDHSKIEELSARLRDMSASMASINKDNARMVQFIEEKAELDDIQTFMNMHQHEAAFTKWLESERQADLFDKFFAYMDPGYLNRLTLLVRLSVGAAVTSSLQTNVNRRLQWLSVALDGVDPQKIQVCFSSIIRLDCHTCSYKVLFQDPTQRMSLLENRDMREVVPLTANILTQRLNALYRTLAQANPPQHDVISHVAQLIRLLQKLHSDYTR
ncbi:hypothetical protein N7462_002680 [Penicillium macrosclerotiorum]|uniref:uncharacterized protein n=1 Tax=Penicillium macrosclerotiorum TaxID=303699 RepID=UPI002547B6DB|nr:uncharacterized protein N7462_002680 [Penicillium macrosclerotiorum]KAJ5693257.1 hypothetical protein N7462_002680 [Penicillium macrosclerotiorum]